tara:strand:- start:176 stop:418 length:243 start_codon:yes stop_codon:yes gene_type:complete
MSKNKLLILIIFFFVINNLKAEDNLEDWLDSKEYRFAVFMSKCKIKQVDGNYRNCNIFNNLKYKTLEHNFKLGKKFKEFK